MVRVRRDGGTVPPALDGAGPRVEAAMTPRGRRTRAALVAAGRRVFERDGFFESRISDIVQEAGVSQGTFYRYFTSKDEILRELIVEVQMDMAAHSQDATPGRDPIANIERANRSYLAGYARNAGIMAILEQLGRDTGVLVDIRRDMRRWFMTRTERAIARWQELGYAYPDLDPHTTAHALGYMIDRFAYTWFVLGEPFREEEAVATLTRIWVRSLGLEQSLRGLPAPRPVPTEGGRTIDR